MNRAAAPLLPERRPERSVLLLSARPRAAANTGTREREWSTLLSGLPACSTCQHSRIYRAPLTAPVLLLLSCKSPDFRHGIGWCCHPAPRRGCEADCAARSSRAARTTCSSRASCCRLCSWACVLAKAVFDSRLRSCFELVYGYIHEFYRYLHTSVKHHLVCKFKDRLFSDAYTQNIS